MLWALHGHQVLMRREAVRGVGKVFVWRLFRGGPAFYHSQMYVTSPKGLTARSEWPKDVFLLMHFAEAFEGLFGPEPLDHARETAR